MSLAVTGPQGRSRRGRESTHRRSYGTPPNPATLGDRIVQGSKSWHSGSFAKYSDIGLVTISFLACCVSHMATGLPVMVHDVYEKRAKTGLPTGMSHKTACHWMESSLHRLRPCTFCSDPISCSIQQSSCHTEDSLADKMQHRAWDTRDHLFRQKTETQFSTTTIIIRSIYKDSYWLHLTLPARILIVI